MTMSGQPSTIKFWSSTCVQTNDISGAADVWAAALANGGWLKWLLAAGEEAGESAMPPNRSRASEGKRFQSESVHQLLHMWPFQARSSSSVCWLSVCPVVLILSNIWLTLCMCRFAPMSFIFQLLAVVWLWLDGEKTLKIHHYSLNSLIVVE